MARFVDWHSSRLRLPPSRRAEISEYGNSISVELEDTRRRVCTKCDRCECECSVTKESYGTEIPADDPRVAMIVAYLGDLLHEALEWITLDGKPFVNPHEVNVAAIAEPMLLQILNAVKAVS